MDYEKKYNEALAIAKETYETQPVYRAWLEKMFPELRESEDERIRKRLIGVVSDIAGGWPFENHKITKKEAITYLEKQKDHFRDDTKKVEKQDYSSLNDLERAIHRGFLSAGVENVPVTIIKETAKECLEQVKLAEWSEDYDEENLQTRFAFYTYKDDPSVLYLSNVFVEETSRNHGFGTRILKAAEKVAEAIGAITTRLKVKQDSPANNWYRKHGYAYMTFEDGYDWLEKNLEYMKPNKQEWSEEDADILNCCISSIEEAKENRYAYKETDGDTSYDREIDWLKSLHPVSKESLQPQQNMSIGFMLYLDEHRPEGKMSLSNAECEDIDKAFKENDWAKIMRYVKKYQTHWKPSKEQINYLGAAVIEAQRRHNDSVNGFPRYRALKELYEQLLKL